MSDDDVKEYNCPPELQKFFANVAAIKQKIQEQYEKTKDPFLLEIYYEFDKTFKINRNDK